jgi:hypothetical protein
VRLGGCHKGEICPKESPGMMVVCASSEKKPYDANHRHGFGCPADRGNGNILALWYRVDCPSRPSADGVVPCCRGVDRVGKLVVRQYRRAGQPSYHHDAVLYAYRGASAEGAPANRCSKGTRVRRVIAERHRLKVMSESHHTPSGWTVSFPSRDGDGKSVAISDKCK